MAAKPGISLCMIVKDEEDMLQDCISSVKDLVDEIIIVDTGSADATVSIAKERGAQVFCYPWDGSFSNARNHSLQQAAYEWILLLDADERMVREDKDKLLEFVRSSDLDGAHFKVYNFIGRDDSRQYTLHNALRLIRNSGIYHFTGDIHEQITSSDGRNLHGRFALTDIRIHHLGYLDNVVLKKGKRSRNLPMLLEQLARTPQDPFTLFNLGNEYMAMKNYQQALKYFYQAKMYCNNYEAYAPHLLFRNAMCHYNLHAYPEAVKTLDEGLKIFPGCTDMEFLKGLIYMESHRDILAIESFEKAMAMGEPHPTLRFSDDCATIRPQLSLAFIYERQGHFGKAAECYIKAIGMDNRLYNLLYNVARTWQQMPLEPAGIEAGLIRFFADINHVPNRIFLIDILLSLHLTPSSQKHLELLADAEGYEMEKALLQGKYCFLNGEYGAACSLFKKALNCRAYPRALINASQDGALMLLAAALLSNQIVGQTAREAAEALENEFGSAGHLLANQILGILQGQKENLLQNSEPLIVLNIYTRLLIFVLTSGDFDLFEKLLYVYNYIDSPRILLSLAEVYAQAGCKGMAASAVLRSIKELDYIDLEGAFLLASAMQ